MESLRFVKKLNVESAIFAINLTEHVKSIYAVFANGLIQSMSSPSVDWSKVAVDTPILVRDSEEEMWRRRHFAKYENGIVYSWSGGATHWTVHRSSNINDWIRKAGRK